MDGAELEIKFAVSEPRLFDVVLADPQVRNLANGKQPLTRSFEALYYDTPDLALKKAGIGYRVRKEGLDWIATFKTDTGSSGGLFSREEWNEKVDGPAAATTPFAGTFAGERMANAIGNQQLQLLFTTNFTRTALQLETTSGATIEMAMDRGTIWGGSGGTPICELELELKSGMTSQLLELAAWVANRWHLQPESRSKYFRGLQLLQSGYASEESLFLDRPERRVADNPGVTALVDRCVADLFLIQAVLASDGASPESIRELRIQCRRLRSVLKFFQPQLKKDDWQFQVDRLRQWGTLLGSVRDIDVLQKSWAEFVDRFSPIMSFSQHWRKVLSERRDFLAEDVIHRLNRSELTQILFELQAWIYREQEGLDAEKSTTKAAEVMVRKGLLQAVKELREDLDSTDGSSSIKKLHRLRIKIKRLRYVQETLNGIPHFRADDFILSLKRLQSAIGKIHDASQIKSLLEQVETGDVNEKFQLEKELFFSWRNRMTTEHMFALPKNLESMQKSTKNQLRTLISLRTGRRTKLRHDADPHEPGE
jgi:inorganic triphosphatase YgiF